MTNARMMLVLMLAAALSRAGDAFAVGDAVEIEFGGVWYPGVVLKVGEKGFFVHYDNYSDSWDSWVEAGKLRRRSAPPGPPAIDQTDPAVGERCEASWNQSWYEIDILEVKDGKFLVHWRGYGSESDEWLPRDRIRRKGEEKEVLPRKGREGDGGGLAPEQMVGKEVEVFWHGKWWPATVKKSDGKRLFIRYAGPDMGTMEEWAVRERVRAPGGAVRVKVDPAAVPGGKGLSGLWWRVYGSPPALVEQHFLFMPDGRLFLGVGINPDDPDFARMQQEWPDGCGGYGLDGDKLHIELGGDADEWKPLAFERVSETQIKLNGVPTFRARPFADGSRLDGTWVTTDAAHIATLEKGGITRSSATVFTFRRDGTFEKSTTLTGAAPGDAPEQHITRVAGTYELAKNHITLRSGAEEATLLACPRGPEEDPAAMVRIGAWLLKRRDG